MRPRRMSQRAAGAAQPVTILMGETVRRCCCGTSSPSVFRATTQAAVAPAKRADTEPTPREEKVGISPALPVTPLTAENKVFYWCRSLSSFVVPATPTSTGFATPWVKRPKIPVLGVP